MFYVLECKSENVNCDIWINDIPVTNRGLDRADRFDGPVNEYLVEGFNELCIEIKPSESTDVSEDHRWYERVPEQACVEIRVSQYPFGAIVGGPDAIERASLKWDVTDVKQGCVWPVVKTVHFDIGLGYGEMSWQRAEYLDLDDADTVNGIMNMLKEIHQSLDSGNHAVYLDFHALKLSDYDAIFDAAPGTKRSRALQELVGEFNEGRKMDSLNEDTSAWRLCAEGRLVECRTADGRGNLRECAKKGGAVDHYPIYAGKIDGKWFALR